MTKPIVAAPDTGGAPVNTGDVAASANAVLHSLDAFNGIIGRIKEGVAEIDAHTTLAKGQIDVHVALAESRISAYVAQELANAKQALQSFHGSALDMDRVEKELQRRRKDRGYGHPDYDEY